MSVEALHRVLIDVVRNRLALGVADRDRARVVHTAPYSSVIAVRARLRDAGVRAARLSGCCQCKGLFVVEGAEEDGRSRTVLAGVSSWVFRVCRRVYEGQPVRIRNRVRIAVRVRQWDRGHRPPGHKVRIGTI